ncbi:MAG: hypothetical protein NTV54_11700 [Ignavibacteriales bacterium]|nr:hypothetical protein [Ignavibacteriales bacterium]
MEKKMMLAVIGGTLAMFAFNGCYTQVASISDNDESSEYVSDMDTSGGGNTVNNYYGSDSYRDWRYQTSFRFYRHTPYWAVSVGWNDPLWYDDFDYGYGYGWDPWYRSACWDPYGFHPWYRTPGYPPYGIYSGRYYGDPYYYGSGFYGIPVTIYSGSTLPERRRTSGPSRGDAPQRPLSSPGGTTIGASTPPAGSWSTRPHPFNEGGTEVRPEAKPRTRPSQETPWWVRSERQRAQKNAEAQTVVPATGRRNNAGTSAEQPQIKRERPRPVPRESVPNDAAPQRRPRQEATPAPRQNPPAERPSRPPETRERQQNREAVSAPSRETPRSAPAVESTPRARKVE